MSKVDSVIAAITKHFAFIAGSVLISILIAKACAFAARELPVVLSKECNEIVSAICLLSLIITLIGFIISRFFKKTSHKIILEAALLLLFLITLYLHFSYIYPMIKDTMGMAVAFDFALVPIMLSNMILIYVIMARI